MDKSEESVSVETGGRRTRSGRLSLPVQVKPVPRKTRKKMVLVEVEVSDEEEPEILQPDAVKELKTETNNEIRTESVDEEAKIKTAEENDTKVVEDTKEKNIQKSKIDTKKVSENVRTEGENKSEPHIEDNIIISENLSKINIEIESSDNVVVLLDRTVIETSLKNDQDKLHVNIPVLNDTAKDTNCLIEDNTILDIVASGTGSSEEQEKDVISCQEQVSAGEDSNVTNEVPEPMEVDDDSFEIQGKLVNIKDIDSNNFVSKQNEENSCVSDAEKDVDMSDISAAVVELTDAQKINNTLDNYELGEAVSEPETVGVKVEAVETEQMLVDSTEETIEPASEQEESVDIKQEYPEPETSEHSAEVNRGESLNETESIVQKEETVDSDEDSVIKEESVVTVQECVDNKQVISADPDAENISEDELPTVQVAKVPETEEVSDEELPGPKRAELPADTEVVSEDELPAVKKEGTKRKIAEGDYDPGSPTSESEVSPKKPFLETETEKEKEKPEKPKKLPELDKYWKAVNDDPTDFTGWTYLLQYVDQENDMEAAREAYDAFLSHYPYCYGYWRKYADYEKRKGNKKKCEEVFERGLKAIPLSVDLWIHYLTYVRTTKPEEEDFVRSQFERALSACGLEFRSDRLWDSYIKWETDAKRLQHATAIYDRLLTTPTQGYTTHFENFQEHVTSNPPNKILEVDEFLALRKEVKHMLKHDVTSEPADNPDVPPGEDTEEISTDEETKAIRERIISIRRKIHKNTVAAVTGRWNFEEGIKRPYFHVKPLERCQLKNWQEYLDYEVAQGDQTRIIVLFERCLIACALYEEFWLKFVHYLEGLKDPELHSKVKDVYERACTIHHIKKPNLHLQWAMFEESIKNFSKAAEILVNLEKSVPNILQVAYRRINLERRREDNEKCSQLYEHYIVNAKNKVIATNLSIKYARFCLKILKNVDKAVEILSSTLTKDANNPRLYLQLIDLTMQKDGVGEKEVIRYLDAFLEKESIDIDQKILFAQRKLEFLEDFGSDIQSVQKAYEEYQKYIKTSKESKKKETTKGDTSVGKKEKNPPLPSSQPNAYTNYGNYGNSAGAATGAYQYSGSQQGQYGYSQYGQNEQYQYGNWQYPQGGYSGYNQWSGYGGGYGY